MCWLTDYVGQLIGLVDSWMLSVRRDPGEQPPGGRRTRNECRRCARGGRQQQRQQVLLAAYCSLLLTTYYCLLQTADHVRIRTAVAAAGVPGTWTCASSRNLSLLGRLPMRRRPSNSSRRSRPSSGQEPCSEEPCTPTKEPYTIAKRALYHRQKRLLTRVLPSGRMKPNFITRCG